MAVDNSRKKTTPPRPNLPPEGQPWGRWVTDTLNELKLDTGGVKREVISSNKNHNAQLQMSAQQKREIVKVNLKAEEALNIALAASGSTTIYFVAPETPEQGDIWYENVTGIWFRWVDDQWVPITDETLLEALEAILAQRIANDDKIRTFAQPDAPTGMTTEYVGDLWYDTDDKNKLYRWDGIEWVPIRDAGITEAQDAADAAQGTADDAKNVADDAKETADTAADTVTQLEAQVTADLGDMQGRLDTAAGDLEELETVTLPALDTRLGSAESAVSAAEGRLDTAEGELTTLTGSTLPALDDRLGDAEAAVSAAEGRLAGAEGELDTLVDTTLPALEGRIGSAESAVSDAEGRLVTAEGELTDLTTNVLPGITDALDDVQGEVSGYSARLTAAEQAVADAEQAVADAEGELATLTGTTLPALDSRLGSAESAVSAAEGRLTAAEGELATLDSDLSQLQTDVDNLVIPSVDGLNKITYSTSAPSATAGYKAGDTWFRYTGTGASRVIYGQWHFTGSAWNEVALRNEMIASLDAGKVTTGFLDAGRIEANTITGDKIKAGSITATHGVFATGAIQNADIGNLNATKINAGTLAAARIGAESIDSTKISSYNLTTTNATIGNAVVKDAAIASLNAAKINAGTLDAARIGANSITAEKLVIASGENLLVDPSFAVESAWTSSTGVTFHATGGMNGGPSVTVQGSGSNRTFYNASTTAASGRLQYLVRVTPGASYSLSLWFKTPEPVTGAAVGIVSGFVDEDGGVVRANFLAGSATSPTADTWHQVTATVVASEGAAYMTFSPSVRGTNTTLTTISNPAVRARVGATLIEDGSITTEKVDAEAITGSKIKAGTITATHGVFATGAIQNADIGNLNATKINAGTLAAARIGANSIDATKISSYNLTTTNATIGNSVITNAMIANLDASKINAGTIAAARIGAKSITGDKIAAGTITATHGVFATGAIVNADIGNLNASKINAGTLNANRIGSDTIEGKHIKGGSITATHGVFATGAIKAADIGSINADTITVGTLQGINISGVTIAGETSLSLTQGGDPLMESTSEGLALYPPGTPNTRTVFRTEDMGGVVYMGIVREQRVGAYWRTRSSVLLGTLPNAGGDGVYTDIETGRIAADRISARDRLSAYRTDSRKGITHNSPLGAKIEIQSRVQMDTIGDGPLEAVQGTFSRGTDQTITATGQTRISLNTTSPGSSNIHLATGGLIQPTSPGVYAIEANVQFDGGESGYWRNIYFRMNGEQVRTYATVASGSSRMVTATAILAFWEYSPTFEVYTSGARSGMRVNAGVQVSVTRIGG